MKFLFLDVRLTLDTLFNTSLLGWFILPPTLLFSSSCIGEICSNRSSCNNSTSDEYQNIFDKIGRIFRNKFVMFYIKLFSSFLLQVIMRVEIEINKTFCLTSIDVKNMPHLTFRILLNFFLIFVSRKLREAV